MLQSISKKRIYFYLLILLLLSSTFNFNIISQFKNLNLIRNIEITGLSKKEKKVLEQKLQIFLNKNIFLIRKDEIIKIINNITFFENYNVEKVFPSKLLFKIKKTEFIGKTILEGEKFYIGKNGKFTKMFLVDKVYNLPQVFGNFQADEFLKLQNTLSLHNFNLNNIKKYYFYKNNRWDIVDNDNITLMLPSNNLEKSLKNYKLFLEKIKVEPGQSVDLRITNKIILTNEKK
tara:strand:+ start:2261 stop:2956 length:696 start_codon:yes stop_codon:yes gene_type:complete